MAGMKTIRWWMSIGLVGCKRGGEFEIEDDASEEDIYDVVWERATQLIETGYEEANPPQGE